MIELIKQILKDKPNRQKHIIEFQRKVWDNDVNDEMFSDLALDLDYYEPDENLRKEDAAYYGDDRLEKELNDFLRKLNVE